MSHPMQSSRTISSRRAALFLFCLLVPVGLPAEETKERESCRLTVFKVWGSKRQEEGEPPKELAKFLEKLKKSSERNSFRLEGKPITKDLTGEDEVSVDLPQGYSARFRVTREKGKLALRQVLTNPKKTESVVDLKKSPVISTLARIREGQETFLLILEWEGLSAGK